jgi:hypothetical protein
MDQTLTYRGYPIRVREVEHEGEKFKYFVTCDSSEYGDYYQTHFFRETAKFSKKKSWFSSKRITVEEPIVLFYVPYNANDEQLSKTWWRNKIAAAVELLDRKAELAKGELI